MSSLTRNIALSTGAVVVHSRMANGAQFASVAGRPGGEMTDAEWEEYCSIVRFDVHGAPTIKQKER